ncbi:hypothetical protein DV736_g6487, partial [Chaetothyriales sp. CBS 134916]
MSFLQDFFTRPRPDEPTNLTTADTGLSPLEQREQHPGEKLFMRRLTEKNVTGAYRKPFEEPDDAQQAAIEKGWLASKRVTLKESDPEYAQARISGQPGRRLGAARGLEFVASLPASNASTLLAHTRYPLEEHRMIYVLEYSVIDDVLSSSPPYPFDDIESLKTHLKATSGSSLALRMIYSCNNEEAVSFLSSDYGISGARAENDERSLRDWMLDKETSKRAANKAIKWRPAYDKARNLVCSAFAVDFGRVLFSESPPTLAKTKKSKRSDRVRLHESMQHQRIAVYMQRTVSSKVPGARMTSFNTGTKSLPEYAEYPTIIISEFSSAGTGEIINAGPLLGLDVSQRGSTRPHAVIQAIEYIMEHVVSGILQLWDTQIDLLHEPHVELEDYIWSQPADSSRAREVWAMSRRLHTMVKLINRHAKLIQFVQEDFRVFAERSEDQSWLDEKLNHFAQLSENIRVDYIEPLEGMIDLMYKSVTIRDSRQSLELNASLWRLSWITFIFLPLTFLSGFFGMNVDAFQYFPSIKWYFVSAVSMLIVVFAFWVGFRTFAPGSKNADYSGTELEDLVMVPREDHSLEAHHHHARGTIRRSMAWLSGRMAV